MGAAFFTTRASVIEYPPGICNILASSPKDACIIDNFKDTTGIFVMNSSFIADIENYTVSVLCICINITMCIVYSI
jgi:hypothetical protein